MEYLRHIIPFLMLHTFISSQGHSPAVVAIGEPAPEDHAIVTGAASGLGYADATQLAAEGATVVLTDINPTAGKAAATKVGRGAQFVRLDVAEEDQWISVIDTVRRRYGRLDILVNNAGILRFGNVETTTLAKRQGCGSQRSNRVYRRPFFQAGGAETEMRRIREVLRLSAVLGDTISAIARAGSMSRS